MARIGRFLRPFLGAGLVIFALTTTAGEKGIGELSDHYSHFISRNLTGVYEWEGIVFVHVRIPCASVRDNARKARMTALLEANRLLRDWAVEQTRGVRRQTVETDVPGLARVQRLMACYEPDWAVRDWKLSVSGREFPVEKNDSDFLVGYAYDKEELKASIPPCFSVMPTAQDALKALPVVLRRTLASGRRTEFLQQAGVPDLLTNEVEEVRNSCISAGEHRELAKKLDEYLRASPFAGEMRSCARSIRGPHSRTTWRMDELSRDSDNSVSVTARTNLNVIVTSVTNEMLRAQSEREQAKWGLSAFGRVTERVVDTEAGVVEMAITRTTVERVRYSLHRLDGNVTGLPLCEDLLLQSPVVDVKPAEQTALGKRAVQAFSTKGPFESKERIVQEAVHENPGDWVLWNLYGRCFQNRNDLLAAVLCFRVSLRLNATYEFAWTNLSIVYAELGYGDLAKGASIMAYGYATSEWCRKHAEEILCAPHQ